MDIKMKALVCFAPFGIAIAVGTSLAAPAYDQYNQRAANVDDKKKEVEELDQKLVNKNKIARQTVELQQAIDALRNAVPKYPDVELLAIDLEKMALESGLEVIAIKEPDKETLKKAGLEAPEPPPEAAGTNFTRGKEQLADRVKQTMAPAVNAGAAVTSAVADAAKPAAGAAAAAAGAAAATAPGAKAKKPGPPPDGGLLKNLVQIKLLGSYKNLMAFTHRLETYQRVVQISDLKASVPKGEQQQQTGTATVKKPELPDEAEPGENDPQGDPERLNISMTLTTYYLP
jgi:Tfp pilus assembly protein PilO